MMKYLYMFCLFAALLLGGCGKKDAPKLVMVTNATFPPYEFVSNQKIDGIDPEIIRRISEALGYELEIQDMSFDSVIAAVQSGKASVAASGITVTEERKKQVSFTIPYVVAEQVVLVKKDSPIRNRQDLFRKRIGVQHGTTGDLFVAKNLQEPERFSNGPLAVAALLAGKIDAVVIDSEPAEVFLAQRSTLRKLPEALTFEEYAFAIAKNNPKLLAEFNRELEKMKKSGELNSIIRSYRDAHSAEKISVPAEKNTRWGKIKDAFHTNFIVEKRYLYLLEGFSVTLQVTAFSVLMGILIGFVVAVIRSTADMTGKLKIADFFCRIYLTVIRGTPVVVQLLIIYFVIFGAVDVPSP